jgi:integrase/recombinase XerD
MPNSSLTAQHKNVEAKSTQSLAGWCGAYLALVVNGSSISTLKAKERDLKLFLEFAQSIGANDRLQYWTPALSKSFQSTMLNTYSPATVSRIMATLRHFARWLKDRVHLAAGDPMQGVKSIKLDEPAWNGLSKKDLSQLKMAVDIRLAASKRKDQNPLLEAAVFYLLLYTGMRESELVNLNFGQYRDHNALIDVRRKGQRVSKKVPVPKDAAVYLDRYLLDEVRNPDEPLFKTRGSNRLHRTDVNNICKRISILTPDRIKLTPHMLRHTFLKRVTDQHGVHIAQKLSGNVSVREIFRYARPSEEESANVVEGLF